MSTLPCTASSVCKKATSQEGYTEHGVNHTKYGDALYGSGTEAEWCAAFIWWTLMQCGVDIRKVLGESNPGWVPNLMAGAKRNGLWHAGHDGLRPGDIALIDTNGDGGPNHVRFVITPKTSSYIGCGGNESNRVRVATQDFVGLVGVVRLPYKPETRPHGPNRQPYTVHDGDTLSSIAQHFYGDADKWPAIYAYNRHVIGSNPNVIKAGLRIVIP